MTEEAADNNNNNQVPTKNLANEYTELISQKNDIAKKIKLMEETNPMEISVAKTIEWYKATKSCDLNKTELEFINKSFSDMEDQLVKMHDDFQFLMMLYWEKKSNYKRVKKISCRCNDNFRDNCEIHRNLRHYFFNYINK